MAFAAEDALSVTPCPLTHAKLNISIVPNTTVLYKLSVKIK